MATAALWSSTPGCCYNPVFVEVFEANEKAIGFYRSCGFVDYETTGRTKSRGFRCSSSGWKIAPSP